MFLLGNDCLDLQPDPKNYQLVPLFSTISAYNSVGHLNCQVSREFSGPSHWCVPCSPCFKIDTVWWFSFALKQNAVVNFVIIRAPVEQTNTGGNLD